MSSIGLYGWNIAHHAHGIPKLAPGSMILECVCGGTYTLMDQKEVDLLNQARTGTGRGDSGSISADDRHTFSSGAHSSGQKPRYDLIPSYALRRMAIRFAEGAAKYGDNNWQKGVKDRAFILDRVNHAMEHLMNLKDRVAATADPSQIPPTPKDDDAAAVCLNAIFVMGWEENL